MQFKVEHRKNGRSLCRSDALACSQRGGGAKSCAHDLGIPCTVVKLTRFGQNRCQFRQLHQPRTHTPLTAWTEGVVLLNLCKLCMKKPT